LSDLGRCSGRETPNDLGRRDAALSREKACLDGVPIVEKRFGYVAIVAPARARERERYTRARGRIADRGRGRATGRPVFAASAAAAAPVADKKAREFPEILSEGLIAIIIVEWVAVVVTAPWGG